MDPMFSSKYNEFKLEVNSCNSCGSFDHTINLCAQNEVNLLILSDIPLSSEDEGKVLLDNLLMAQGFNKEQYTVSSIVKCLNVNVNSEVCKNCRRHLANEFRVLKPSIIVLLGSGAHEAFFGVKPDGNKVRGVISKVNGYNIMTTCNPTRCLDNNNLKMMLYEDMHKIGDLLNKNA